MFVENIDLSASSKKKTRSNKVGQYTEMAKGLARSNGLLNTILSIRETEEAEEEKLRIATTQVNKQMSDKKNNDSIRSMKSLNMKSKSIMMNRVNSH